MSDTQLTETEDYSKVADPNAHADTHQAGGADQINVANLSGELADPQKSAWDKVSGKPSAYPPEAHATAHQDGGADQINVAGLSGELADPQPPKTHAATHEGGGSDQISVAGLSGELADPQPPKTHAATHEGGGSDPLPWGSGGGLDADKLDGYHAADLLPPTIHTAFNYETQRTFTGTGWTDHPDLEITFTNTQTETIIVQCMGSQRYHATDRAEYRILYDGNDVARHYVSSHDSPYQDSQAVSIVAVITSVSPATHTVKLQIRERATSGQPICFPSDAEAAGMILTRVVE
ncbi:MAG: hypothetical protein JRD89_04495 [Deltaproteobacteria bacterium]|nr:hypothetical protein [Deltaproteobacteria bacterium]